jgi:hypothetical protein
MQSGEEQVNVEPISTMLNINTISYHKEESKSPRHYDILFSPGLLPFAGEAEFLITPFDSKEFPVKPLVISAQSHSSVIGICQRSCGINGC